MTPISDRLREAAKTLRERAEAATPGPWIAYVSDSEDLGGDVADVTTLGCCSCDHSCNRTDPFYIATMHPGVGLALADWLDAMARSVIGTSTGDVPYEDHARRLADLILGSAS